MVVLSAQSSDEQINKLAPDFFNVFPTLKSLCKAAPEMLFPSISKIRGYIKRLNGLLQLRNK
jgi:endonuclease-3